jgi:hypothetical protein
VVTSPNIRLLPQTPLIAKIDKQESGPASPRRLVRMEHNLPSQTIGNWLGSSIKVSKGTKKPSLIKERDSE